MGNARFSDDFKRDAVHQITVRGYPVKEVSQRLGVSTYSLYIWVKRFSKASDADSKDDRAAENKRQTKLIKEAWEESGEVYGYRKQRLLKHRQFLHAHKLDLIHPVTKVTLLLSAPLPQDHNDILRRLRH